MQTEKQRERLVTLLKFAKSINSNSVTLEREEYLYLLEYIEKAESENALKERNNGN